MDDVVEENFTSILLSDVIAAFDRHHESGSQANKREFIRTAFAAIEGLTWIFREHAIETAQHTAQLKRDEEIALSEISYQISESGRITRQQRYLPLLATIRLTARIANRVAPEYEIDFSNDAWDKLRQTIRIRNRITHPKTAQDLILTEDDIRISLAALFWFLEETGQTMVAINFAAKEHLGRLDEILQNLKAGDAETLAEYHAAARSLGDDDMKSI
jgi:hypothetical protein